jgi:hypothetical protein
MSLMRLWLLFLGWVCYVAEQQFIRMTNPPPARALNNKLRGALRQQAFYPNREKVSNDEDTQNFEISI